MTTRVDITLSRRENVLAIPHEAVRSDRGKKVCFVAHDESLERREVRIGQETTDLVEVIDGSKKASWSPSILRAPRSCRTIYQL